MRQCTVALRLPSLLGLLLLLVAWPALGQHAGHGGTGVGGPEEREANIPTLTSAEDPLASVRGDYVEARTSDVWTGPCFANGEVNLEGQEAVMAWRVSEGSWQGVDLDGLSVAAVVIASATLGDPHADPLPARSLLLVDDNASASQREALAALARRLGGEVLGDVVATEAVPIAFEVQGQRARLAVGSEESAIANDVARARLSLETRPLGLHDTHCGNEFIYYPPLAETVEATPAGTVTHRFEGSGRLDLGTSWSSPDKRSAFVGRFAL